MSSRKQDTRTRRERANDRDDVVQETLLGLKAMIKWVITAGFTGFVLGAIGGWLLYDFWGALIFGLLGAIVCAVLLPIARVIGTGFFDL